MDNIYYKDIFETIVNKTIEYLEENNIETMVLGISGGIDSTVTAAICAEIVARQPQYRFIGVCLPCSTNTQEERSSASKTLDAFCKYNDRYEDNLQKEFSLLREKLANCYGWLKLGEDAVSIGNIKARLRMMYLYNIAALADGIVMGTGNLTEYNLGFWTIHGDVGDFNPIGGLWKHEVYGLAKWLANEHYADCPDQTSASQKIQALRVACTITPTDGNGVNAGGDLAQIAPGLTYEQVDDVLITLLDPKLNMKHYSKHFKMSDWPKSTQDAYNGLCEKYTKRNVFLIINSHMYSEFKRKKSPVEVERKEFNDYIVKNKD